MARYKPVDRNPRLLPVVLSEQIQPGTFEFEPPRDSWRLFGLSQASTVETWLASCR
jgi:hypothetical protein